MSLGALDRAVAGRPPERSPRAPRHRPGPAPNRLVGDAFAALVGLGLGAVVASVVGSESRGALAAPGGLLTASGRLAGFTGAYLMLVMVLLAARLPALERSVGQDRLLRWHRRTGPVAICLICAHVVLVTCGYAALARSGILAQLWSFVTSYPDLLAAVAGFCLVLMAALTSIRFARRKMRYETWWAVHLYTYLGLALAFAHQIVTGAPFIGHPLTRALWIAAWAATAGVVLAFRVCLPLWRSLRHRLRVVRVGEEAPGVYSVVCSGRRLERLAVSGGQFFQWRFLTKGQWWQAHPYSLSALPRPPYLRLTVKASGDHGRAVAALRPGTRVFVEGPYGAFTHHARSTNRLALIGAGVGITPLRALLEELPLGSDVAVVVRASREEDLVHRQEVAALVGQLGGRLHELIGPRSAVRLDARRLRSLVPDLARRDVYVCGPEPFAEAIVAAARKAGVRRQRIHREEFAF